MMNEELRSIYLADQGEGAEGHLELWEVDPTTTDEERVLANVPPLADALAHAEGRIRRAGLINGTLVPLVPLSLGLDDLAALAALLSIDPGRPSYPVHTIVCQPESLADPKTRTRSQK